MRIFTLSFYVLMLFPVGAVNAVTCNPILDNLNPVVKNAIKASVTLKTSYISEVMFSSAVGSGFILNKSGYFVTAFHNLEYLHNMGSLENVHYEVTLFDCRKYTATFFWSGEKSGLVPDMAILKIKDPPKNLVPAIINHTNELKNGDSVLAIGSPHGSNNKVVFGEVVKSNAFEEEFEIIPLIYATTHIERGYSGGMLVNSFGHVVGLTVKCNPFFSIEHGIICAGDGYFTPINLVMKWIDFLDFPSE